MHIIRRVRSLAANRWLIPFLLQSHRVVRRFSGDIHAMICIADHFEPRMGNASDELARARVEKWVNDYPAALDRFRDSDGRPPRHTFFYPIDEYEPEFVDALTTLCRAGYGEIELHLHHDHDTAENLSQSLRTARDCFHSRHGLLPRNRWTGRVGFGFVHGNWALDNSRSDGRWCGVNNELDVLRAAGCYADFTYPSAPDPTQPAKFNSIYYAIDDADRPRSHHRGTDVGAGAAPANGLMLIQGPLVLDWSSRRFGIMPKLENACVQISQPLQIDRLAHWLRAGVQVRTRPDWFFIKLHAHGAHETSYEGLLGESAKQFHQALADRASREAGFHYHYVTAREMYNLVKAAEAGWRGSVFDALDYELVWRGARPATPWERMPGQKAQLSI
jgi:hypothetical protein